MAESLTLILDCLVLPLLRGLSTTVRDATCLGYAAGGWFHRWISKWSRFWEYPDSGATSAELQQVRSSSALSGLYNFIRALRSSAEPRSEPRDSWNNRCPGFRLSTGLDPQYL